MPIFTNSLEVKEVDTTDATPTTLVTIPIAEDCAGRLQMIIIGRAPAPPGFSGTWSIDYGFEREPGANPAVVGTGTKNKMGSLGAANWDVNVTTSGVDILVQVIGDVGDDAHWTYTGHFIACQK